MLKLTQKQAFWSWGEKDIQKAKKFVIKNNFAKDKIKIVKGRLGSNYFFITDPNGILMEIKED